MLPEPFLRRLQRQLGQEYESYLASLDRPRAVALRFNPLKTQDFPVLPFVQEPVPWADYGYYYDPDARPGLHVWHEAGLYYLQEASAMAPVTLLDPQPGERICDLCAAPGGKTTQIAGKMMGEGLLVCNEINPKRAKILSRNIERMGVANALVLNHHPSELERVFTGAFDKVLVDAPCSGEGMFRKDPEAARVWSPEKSAACAKQQREIISQAARMLRPGGLLLYSTCTFSPEENEQIIAGLLRERQDMRLMDLEGYEGFGAGRPDLADGNPDLVKCVRIWPHRMAGEGHFLALLQKEGEAGRQKERPASERPGLSKGERKSLEEFFSEVSGFAIDRMEVRKGRVYYRSGITEEQKGLTFLRNGLYLGELKKDRFEPGQAFAMALKKDSYGSVLDFGREDERVVRYLKGETVTVDDLPVGRRKGWQLVCVEGYPLGWGKLVNGTLKNKYASGWRMKE